jgi:hypothetical protein
LRLHRLPGSTMMRPLPASRLAQSRMIRSSSWVGLWHVPFCLGLVVPFVRGRTARPDLIIARQLIRVLPDSEMINDLAHTLSLSRERERERERERRVRQFIANWPFSRITAARKPPLIVSMRRVSGNASRCRVYGHEGPRVCAPVQAHAATPLEGLDGEQPHRITQPCARSHKRVVHHPEGDDVGNPFVSEHPMPMVGMKVQPRASKYRR